MLRNFALAVVLIMATLLCLPGCSVGKKRQNDAKVHYMLGNSYLQEPNPTLALKEFLLAEEANPYDGDIQVALGQTYQIKKAYTESERHYQRALDLDPGNPLYQNNLAALYLDMRRWDDAIKLFKQAGENLIFTNSEVAFAGMGFAYYQKGDPAAAIVAYRQSLEHNSRYLLPRLRLAELFMDQGKLDAAMFELGQAQAQSPATAEVHYLRGLVLMKRRDNTQAELAFRDAIRLAGDSEIGKKAAQRLQNMH